MYYSLQNRFPIKLTDPDKSRLSTTSTISSTACEDIN
jgi:hypothetical protein